MKKTLLLAILLDCAFFCHAQIEKGKWMAGVNLQFDLQNSKGEDDFTSGNINPTGKGNYLYFNINGELLHQLKNNAAIGIGIGGIKSGMTNYNSNNEKNYSKDDFIKSVYLIYQLQKKIANKFSYNPRIETYFNDHATTETHYTSGPNTVKNKRISSSYGLNLKPLNIRFFISNRFFIESTFLTLNYDYNVYKSYYLTDRVSKGTTSQISVTGSMILNNLSLFYTFN